MRLNFRKIYLKRYDFRRARQDCVWSDTHTLCIYIVARKIQRAGIWIHRYAIESTRGTEALAISSFEEQRQAKSLGYTSKGSGGGGGGGSGERKGVRTREIPPTFSGVTISSHLSAALAALVGKANSGKLARFATDRHASRNPTCFLSTRSLLSSLGQYFSPFPPLLFPFSTPFHSFLSFHLLQPVPSRPFSTPLATWLFQTSSDFIDPSRRRYHRIVKVSSR